MLAGAPWNPECQFRMKLSMLELRMLYLRITASCCANITLPFNIPFCVLI